jgi:hypothetical protein
MYISMYISLIDVSLIDKPENLSMILGKIMLAQSSSVGILEIG